MNPENECNFCGKDMGNNAGQHHPDLRRSYHFSCVTEMKKTKVKVYRITNEEDSDGGIIATPDELVEQIEASFDFDNGECAYVFPITRTKWELENLPEFCGF